MSFCENCMYLYFPTIFLILYYSALGFAWSNSSYLFTLHFLIGWITTAFLLELSSSLCPHSWILNISKSQLSINNNVYHGFFSFWNIVTCELRSILILTLCKQQKIRITFLFRFCLSTYYWPLNKMISQVIIIFNHIQAVFYILSVIFLSCSFITYCPFQHLEYIVQMSCAYFPVFLHSLNSQLHRTIKFLCCNSAFQNAYMTDMSKLPLQNISKYNTWQMKYNVSTTKRNVHYFKSTFFRIP